MAKDYFQDILQPDEGKSEGISDSRKLGGADHESRGPAERSIRNITVSHRAARTRGISGDVRGSSHQEQKSPRGSYSADGRSRVWLWVVASVSVVALVVVAILAVRDTKVTVTPHSRPITFEQSAHFFAYPASTSSAGTLTYTTVTNDIEDSAVVPSSGTERAEERASGNIEVLNTYSASSVRLIKNTRFTAPNGLVFRVPATVVIPGKRGTTPGSIEVTVFADQPGEQYNIGPVDKFTLPGLKSSADMYDRVYARSSSSFRGGFIGERPAVAPASLETARAEVRGRIESKARDSARSLSGNTATVFPDLIKIRYESLPSTSEAGGGVRIHEKARVEVPVLNSKLFAQNAARVAGENADGVGFSLVGLDKVVARKGSASITQVLGKDPLDFTLSGAATLVWDVDTVALSEALAGRSQSAFQQVITGFPGIKEASARVEPFWKGTFPASSSEIIVEFAPLPTL